MRSLAASVALFVLFGCSQADKAPEKDVAPLAASEPAPAKTMDGCPGEEQQSCGSLPAAAEGQQKFGSFALAKSEPLAAVASAMGDEKKTVQVSGAVDSVCQKKGCWMVLKDGDVTARVFTHAGDFYLPTATEKGRTAIVEGELEARTMSEKFARHLAEDQGADPEAVKGPQKELVINATAIALK